MKTFITEGDLSPREIGTVVSVGAKHVPRGKYKVINCVKAVRGYTITIEQLPK